MPTDGRSGGEDPFAELTSDDRRRRRREDHQRVVRRRRAAALTGVAALAALIVVLVTVVFSGGGHTSSTADRAANASEHQRAPAPTPTLPRGGRTILPGHLVVAYYGIVGTSNILGQTHDPEADAAGVIRQARAYAGAGTPVQPAFELVTTIASTDAGPDGTYSTPADPALVRRYLAVAHRHKLLLVLDFQPGRGEFLPQVKRYARILRDPSVGVALDPEWKVGPGQVPTGQIGSAQASSINAVSSYLSQLVQANRLPQKLFIVHQFRLAELPDRQRIARRPGLGMVLQMDGLGAVAVKLSAYHQVQRGAYRQGFYPGFKVFLRRTDDPELMTPARVLKLRPRPVYVSYQ